MRNPFEHFNLIDHRDGPEVPFSQHNVSAMIAIVQRISIVAACDSHAPNLRLVISANKSLRGFGCTAKQLDLLFQFGDRERLLQTRLIA